MEEPEIQWITASEALDTLVEVYGNRRNVKAWLADALRDDKLACKASKTWVSQAPKLSFKVPRDPVSFEQDITVPAKYWRSRSRSWASDQERWRWPSNQAVVTLSRKPLKRRLFSGLQFLKADVDRLAKIPGPSPEREPSGPKTRAREWGIVAARLCVLHERGEFVGKRPSANELATKLKILTSELFGNTALWEFSKGFLDSYQPANSGKSGKN